MEKDLCKLIVKFENLLTKKVLSILFSLLFSVVMTAQVSQELSGTIIYYDGHNQPQQYAPDKAFDHNPDTYFKSDGLFGNWIGYDFGSPQLITSIEYYARQDNKPEEYAERLTLGVFEGANNPDFGDAIAIGIIKTTPTKGKNILTCNVSKGFRYVRFVFPSNNKPGGNDLSKYVAELSFFGYPGEGTNNQLTTLTNLPTVNIHTVEARDITSKEVYLKGVVSFVYDNGTKIYTDSLHIRGRGNNSWTHPKKPYRLKLYKSVKLMGLPAKAKNWTLINNYGDKTLMRNILACDFARRLQMPYTSPTVAVDVVVNGDYKGCYQLCDHIDVRKNRVDVEEMGADDLTGGYAIEIDAYASLEPKQFTSRAYHLPVTIKYPNEDAITPAQEQYIAEHFNKLTDAIQAPNYKDPQNGYRKYLDIESFLRHFLVGEYSGNTDTYWSVRMAKKRNEEHFFVSPVWDFDLAFENDRRTYPIMYNTESIYNNEWMSMWDGGTSSVGDIKNMLRRMFADNGLTERLKQIYARYRNNGSISKNIVLNVVDSCANLLQQSQELNFKRWPILNEIVHENPVIHGTYSDEVRNVRDYVATRMDWLDKKLGYVSSDIQNRLNSDVVFRVNSGTIELTSMAACELMLVDVSGRIISEKHKLEANTELRLSLEKGVYLMVLADQYGQTMIRKCIIN